MATILNIETSGAICSVAVSQDGMVEYQLEDLEPMNHAKRLAPFIDKCMEEIRRRDWKLDAVAVSIGPGSYTGLRIGLSAAKGLCFGLGIPLLTVSTLEILAVKAMFRSMDWTGEEILVPMLDARRMEVYTAVFSIEGKQLTETAPHIVTEESFTAELAEGPVLFIGDGAEKCRGILTHPNAHFAQCCPKASSMLMPAMKEFNEEHFRDVAYFEPFYLKEFVATVSKKKLF